VNKISGGFMGMIIQALSDGEENNKENQIDKEANKTIETMK